jgi:DNA-binding MarR family transcriptional regulator
MDLIHPRSGQSIRPEHSEFISEMRDSTLLSSLQSLLSKIATHNVSRLHPTLPATTLTGIQILLGLMHCPGEHMTKQRLMTYLESPLAMVDAALCELLEEGLITQVISNSTVPDTLIALTPLGRECAKCHWHWPQDLHTFTLTASRSALEDLYTNLLKIIRSMVEQRTINLSQLCIACNFFKAFVHPNNPMAPHHCDLVNGSLGDSDLKTEYAAHLSPSNS